MTAAGGEARKPADMVADLVASEAARAATERVICLRPSHSRHDCHVRLCRWE
jgi:hypothetical protein